MGTFRNFVMRGALFLVPISVTIFVAKWAVTFVDAYLGEPTAALVRVISPGWLLSVFPDGHVPGMSMVLLLLLMFVLGAIASWPIGHKGLRLLDLVVPRVPIVGGIYSSTRKIVETFGETNRFQRAVWFDYAPGLQAIGFVTHELIEETSGEKKVVIFYPMVPNPSSGLLLMMRESETIPLDMDPKEVFTMLVALGATMPDRVRIPALPAAPPAPPTPPAAEE